MMTHCRFAETGSTLSLEMTTWCYRSVTTHCRFAQTFFCHGLEKTAQRYLLQNFQTVYNTSNEYLQLDVEEVGGNRF